MTTYVLTYTQPYEPPLVRALDVDDPADLPQEIHRHLRGYLGGNRVDVHFEPAHLCGHVRTAGMLAGTFTVEIHEPEPEDAGTPAPGDVHSLRFGYNLADLEHLTRVATRRPYGRVYDSRTRYETAWSAIAEHLYAAVARPEPIDLINAGSQALSTLSRTELHHRGRQHRQPGEPAPRFEIYWNEVATYSPSPEARIVDRTALWQIWPQLRERDREVLLALATHGDYQLAAASLGIAVGTFQVTIARARKAFRELWHEGETPSRHWGGDRRVQRRGEERIGEADYRRARRASKRRVTPVNDRPVHELVHGKASTYSNHGCRCVPCKDAAAARAREYSRSKGAKPRRRITESQLADIRARRAAGETYRAIADDLGFADSYICRLVTGVIKPAPDPVSEVAA